MNEDALPTGWVWTRLGEVAEKIVDGTHFTPKYVSSGVPFISVKDIRNGKISFDDCRYISQDEHETLIKRCNPEYNDVLITKSGTIGRTAVIKTNKIFSLFVSVALIKPFKNYLDSDFVSLMLENYINNIDISQSIKGGVIKNFHLEDLKVVDFPLPPLPEQRRIVTKIEELFTKLDAGISALRKTQAQLKRYHQSVLKAACEGKLVPTEAELARMEGRAYEPADVLLARILKERREKSKGAKYKEPAAPDTDVLRALPEGWGWATIEQMMENLDGIRIPVKESDRDKIDGKYPYYGASGIIDYVNDFLFEGDFLLVAEDGANLLSRSTPIAFQAHDKFWVNNHAHILKSLAMMPLGYLETYVNSIDLKFYITGSAQPKLTQANMNGIPVPLPPLAEQRRIVAEVERRLSVADEVARTVEQSLAQAQRLRQSILKKAFEGKLVAQDAKDEPASALVERIRLQNQSVIKKGRSKR
jgi:type I restriction enzyme S subunit